MNLATRPFPADFTPSGGIARRRWTADELEQMLRAGILSEDDRLELIDGEVVTMSPKGARHEVLRNELILNWARRLPSDIKFAEEPPLRLSPHDEPEPDIILFPANLWVDQTDGGTVLLVVEIADSSLSYNLMVKAPKYAAFGVREYWVIDTKTLTTTVHRAPYNDTYRDVREVLRAELLTPLNAPALAVRLADLRLE